MEVVSFRSPLLSADQASWLALPSRIGAPILVRRLERIRLGSFHYWQASGKLIAWAPSIMLVDLRATKWPVSLQLSLQTETNQHHVRLFPLQ